ncbi:MAG: hypothetical protein AAFS04_07195 [Cyanobacteria bacterium J06631_9]
MMSQRIVLTPQRADQLTDIYRALRPEPLTTQAELDTFYTPEINAVRGGDKMQRLKLGLTRAQRSRPSIVNFRCR